MSQSAVSELLELSQKLLDVIAKGDWETYQLLCDPTLSAFEAEARGHLVEGLEFHEFYFALPRSNSPVQNTISCPRVRLLGENAAVVTYVRLTQKLDAAGHPVTNRTEETRVWERQDGVWRHVHFHRSSNA